MKKFITTLTVSALFISALDVTAFNQQLTDSWKVIECGDTSVANYQSIPELLIDYTELKNFLNSYIPYNKTDSVLNSNKGSNIVTSTNDFIQKIEVTNGSLFFNNYIPLTNDIIQIPPKQKYGI